MAVDDANPPGGKLVTIVNENLEVSMNAENRSGLSVQPLAEDDRTLRAWAVNILRRTVDTAGNAIADLDSQEVRALAEADGTPKVSLYGTDDSSNLDPIRTNADQQVEINVFGRDSGGTNDPLRTNSDQQLQIQLHGADGSSNSDALRTDGARIVRTRPFEPFTHVTPQTIAGTVETLYTVPASTVSVVEVELVNNSATSRTVTLHIVESGGTAGSGNIALFEVPVARRTVGIRVGPYSMQAGATVQALCSSADAITGHVYVKEYGTGDAVAY
jgi:hypothetical protein